MDKSNNEEKYTGFLFVKCENCGDTKAYCAKFPTQYHKCKVCGAHTEFHNLRKMFIRCECGRKAKYLTNVTDKMVDVPCPDCGSPVAVELDSRRMIYKTIKEAKYRN